MFVNVDMHIKHIKCARARQAHRVRIARQAHKVRVHFKYIKCACGSGVLNACTSSSHEFYACTSSAQGVVKVLPPLPHTHWPRKLPVGGIQRSSGILSHYCRPRFRGTIAIP